MYSTLLVNISRFIVLLALQIIIFNNMNFLGYISPFPYILFIILYPVNGNKTALVVASFLLGLVMDMFNNVHGMYVGYKAPTEKYGSIANLLGLDAEREPVEYAEVKLKGKNIPVGILLGYQLGLGNL